MSQTAAQLATAGKYRWIPDSICGLKTRCWRHIWFSIEVCKHTKKWTTWLLFWISEIQWFSERKSNNVDLQQIMQLVCFLFLQQSLYNHTILLALDSTVLERSLIDLNYMYSQVSNSQTGSDLDHGCKIYVLPKLFRYTCKCFNDKLP